MILNWNAISSSLAEPPRKRKPQIERYFTDAGKTSWRLWGEAPWRILREWKSLQGGPMGRARRDEARETGPALESHYRFIIWLVPVLDGFPRSQRFLLGDRIQGIAMDVLESLIEATYTRQRGAHLAQANLGIKKLRFLCRLARDLRHLDRRRYENSARCLDESGRRIGAWSKAHRASEGT